MTTGTAGTAHILTFNHTDWDGNDWQHAAIHCNNPDRVMMWFKEPGKEWKLGHGKPIPEGWTADQVAETMRQFITNQMDHEKYYQLLPGRLTA